MARLREFLFDRDFYRSVLTLGLPIAAQNLLSSSANLIDTVMVGQLGEVSLSAVGMAGQWSFLMFLFFFGFSSGSSVFFSQYWGIKDLSRIRHTYTLGFANVFIISLIFMVVGYCFPAQVIRVFTNDEVVVAEGVLYLRVAVFAYVAQCVKHLRLRPAARHGGSPPADDLQYHRGADQYVPQLGVHLRQPRRACNGRARRWPRRFRPGWAWRSC